MNSHNPHVIPGQYNPQRQDKTGIDLSSLYPGFSDPTQVPMTLGDTAIPMQVDHPEMIEEVRSSAHNSSLPHPANDVRSSPPITNIPIESGVITPIRIPIVIELTINLNVNHGS